MNYIHLGESHDIFTNAIFFMNQTPQVGLGNVEEEERLDAWSALAARTWTRKELELRNSIFRTAENAATNHGIVDRPEWEDNPWAELDWL